MFPYCSTPLVENHMTPEAPYSSLTGAREGTRTPIRRSGLDPKSSASASSATLALSLLTLYVTITINSLIGMRQGVKATKPENRRSQPGIPPLVSAGASRGGFQFSGYRSIQRQAQEGCQTETTVLPVPFQTARRISLKGMALLRYSPIP